jgi:hypothetical protein
MEAPCIVITGKIVDRYVLPLLELYKDVKNKILSTWIDQPYIALFERNGFNIILNEYPSHRNSTNYQTVCIREGCILAQKLGFKYVIRMRTDLICSDMTKFLNCIPLDDNKLSVLGFIQTHNFYIIDFFVAGSTETMLKVFSKEQTPDDTRFVEQYWIDEYFGKKLTYADAVKNINTCYATLKEKGVEMILLSKDWGFLISMYCKQEFFRN